jgi:hypothetical protein
MAFTPAMINNLYTNQYSISNIPAGQVAILGSWYFVQSSFSMNSFSQSSFRMVESMVLSKYIYDYFNQANYLLASPNQLSSNRQWSLLDTGGMGATVGVQNQTLMIKCQPPHTGSVSQTNPPPPTTAPNHVIQCFVMTVLQLRTGAAGSPNTYEVACILFKYTDNLHYYYFRMNTNGCELGKCDNSPTRTVLAREYLNPCALGNFWFTWNIKIIGNHITILVNNRSYLM